MTPLRAALAIFLMLQSSLFCLNAQAGSTTTKPSSAGSMANTDIPLKRVVLYTSGLAYYEHVGTVEGNATVRLSFKVDQINDVLKSIVLRDLGGGTIQAVSYGAQDPIERSLESFALDLSGQPSLAEILTQVKGHRLTLGTPSIISGRLLGLENRRKMLGNPDAPVESVEVYINLWSDTGIRSIPLASVQTVQIEDQRLQAEVNAALELLQGSTDTQRRTVEISCRGSGKREVRFGYLQEAPVWKTSYRLDLSGALPYLQAWALIENASDNDWKDVALSLAGGQPMAFIQDLYTPLWISRPVVEPFRPENLAPRTYDEGISLGDTMAPPSPAPAMERLKKEAMPQSLEMAEESYYADPKSKSSSVSQMQLDQGFASGAAMNAEGEVFFYDIKDRVSISRRQSAMIPLIAGDLTGQKVSIYNGKTHAKRPLYGAWIKSMAGTRFPAGPLSVFDGGMYAGDALIDGLKDTERKLLSYGLDLDVLVQAEGGTGRTTTGWSLVKGVLYQKVSQAWTQTYTIKNSSGSSRNLVVEHPYIPGRTLKSPLAFEEKTDQVYRFLLPLGPGETKKFLVEEQQALSESVSLLGVRASGFASYTNIGSEMSAEIKDALGKAAVLKQALETHNQKIQDLGQRRNSIGNDQARIRDNLESVGRDSAEGQRYVKRLVDQDAAIDAIDVDIEKTRKLAAEAQKTFETWLNSLNL